jgi:hypothetical protein
MLSVLMEGKHVGAARGLRSPIRIVCSPSNLSPAETDVSGEGASFCTVNRESMFLLQPRDAYGNLASCHYQCRDSSSAWLEAYPDRASCA